MSSQEFDAQVRSEGLTAIIDLRGEINAQAEVALNHAYTQANSSNSSKIILNFSQVEYINSTGIALIVGLLAQARMGHKTLAVFGLSDHYREIFNITRLADFMNIYQDEASALAI